MITVPLKAVMAVLFVVIAAVAVIVAFVPTTLVGISSNEDTGKKLQRTTSDYVTQSITAMLSPPTNIYSTLLKFQRSDRLDANILTPAVVDYMADDRATVFLDEVKDEMNSHRSSTLAAAAATVASSSTSATSTTNIVSNVFAYVPHSKRLYGSQDYLANAEVQYSYSDLGQNVSIYFSGYLVRSSFTSIPNIIDTVPSITFMQFIITLTDDSIHCTPGMQITYYGGGIVCGFRYVDPRNATKDVYVGMMITSATISQQISLISATENTLITVVMSATKEVVGLSWGEETETRLDLYDNFSAPYEQRIRLKAATEIQHPTVQAALAALGGPSGMDGRTYPYRFSIGSGRDEIYGDLNIYQDNSTGLSMYVLVTMPKDDFLGTIYRTTYLIAGIVCGACVLLMVIGVVFAYCLVRPLDELGERMQLTASFKDDGTHSSTPSRMSEINQLQASFETMRDQLNTMKAYLPQSVLEALRGTASDSDDDDDEEGIDAFSSVRQENESIPSGSININEGNNNSVSHRMSVLDASMLASSVATGNSAASRRSTSDLSVRSRTSGTMSNTGKKGRKANVTKRFTASLTAKTVTIVSFNLRNTHSTWGQLQASLPVVQERYLSVILARCQENRGVVDTFQGDRVIASFNAVRSCAQSGRRAVQVALEVVALCARSNTIKSSVTAGVASGRALVGNSGAAEMMKFNVIGPVVGEAVALERCARVATSNQAQFVRPGEADTLALGQFRNTTPVYLHSGFKPFVNELELHFYLQPIDIVRRKLIGNPQQTSDSEQVVLLAPHQRPKGTSDEWMYELADKSGQAPFKAVTELFTELITSTLNDTRVHIKDSLRGRAIEIQQVAAKKAAPPLATSHNEEMPSSLRPAPLPTTPPSSTAPPSPGTTPASTQPHTPATSVVPSHHHHHNSSSTIELMGTTTGGMSGGIGAAMGTSEGPVSSEMMDTSVRSQSYISGGDMSMRSSISGGAQSGGNIGGNNNGGLASSALVASVAATDIAVVSSVAQLLHILDRCNHNDDDDGTAMWLCS